MSNSNSKPRLGKSGLGLESLFGT